MDRVDRDFAKEMSDIFKRNDLSVPVLTQERSEPELPAGPLYNIHKRSLPVTLDKIVAMNLTEEEAKRMTIKLLKTKVNKSGEGLVYYDVIRVGATEAELSPFYNRGPIVEVEG